MMKKQPLHTGLAWPLVLASLALLLAGCGHSHEDDTHSHGEDTHTHGEEGQPPAEDGHTHGEDTHTHAEEGQGQGEDAHTHGEDTHTHGEDTHTHEGDGESLSDTVWNARFELFMEHPPIRVGEPVEFLVHLTILDGSRPVNDGPVSFIFTRSGREVRRIVVKEPLRPGIFSVDTQFDTPGRLDLTIDIQGGPVQGSIEASPLTVHAADGDAAGPAAQEESAQEGTISFLKEQQWTFDFSTALAEQREIEGSLGAPALVTAPSGLDTAVFSPSAGHYRQPPQGVPRLGTRVKKGALLGWVEPTPTQRSAMAANQVQSGQMLVGMRNALAQAESDVAEQKSLLRTAQHEVERLERLLELQAVPRKRLEEAQSRHEIHQASLEAAQTRRRQLRHQLDEQLSRADAQKVEPRMALYSPIEGKIVRSQAADGQPVDSRQELFRIINLKEAWISARVGESEVPRLKGLKGALVDLPGGEQIRLEADRLLDVGSLVDPVSRTVPVTWRVPNRSGSLRAGMLVEMRMRTDEGTQASAAVPSGAVLIEDNKSVVYVQVSGESFARRIVRTGARDAGWTQILEGLESGERVVVKGAYEVALAARAGDANAAHGHAH
ncbi:MAG TPA: efflux RND transporter periplasmic adaptor subunit [Acidobacteriota bacterium]|nr:efflux RND transporter periplasmic adaptor subunit [Acidobacteriota bacterium]